MWGIAYAFNQTGGRDGFGTPWVLTDLLGYEDWLSACKGYMLDPAEAHAESTEDYRFDAASIEGQGLEGGFTVGYYTPGEEYWPKVAEPYGIVCSAQLQSPAEVPLYIAIAGSEADGVLLTSSTYAEVLPESSDGGGEDDPDDPPHPPTPHPNPPTPNPNPYNPPDDPDDPVAPDDPVTPPGGGGSGIDWLEKGIYLTGRDGIQVYTTRNVTKTSGGLVTAITYEFTLVLPQATATTSVKYAAGITLTTQNGGTYTYRDEECTMYYGFSAASYSGSTATLRWKSSYSYSDTDPKTATASTSISGKIKITAEYEGIIYTSESLPSSNVLVVRKTGRTRSIRVNGAGRVFDVYTVGLNKRKQEDILLNRALSYVPETSKVTLSPASETGTNSGPPDAPTVNASLTSLTIAHNNPYSSAGTKPTDGLDFAVLDAKFTPSAAATVTVTGSSSWGYDDNQRATGSISATFSPTLAAHTTDLT